MAQAEGKSDSERIAIGKKYFRENFNARRYKIDVDPSFRIEADRIIASVSADTPTTLMKVVGINELPIESKVEVVRPRVGNAEIVMVLDYSGSMRDNNKYSRMADNAKNFIDNLAGSLQNGSDVKFALVPFSDFVAVDLPNYAVHGQPEIGMWTGCTQERFYPYNRTATPPTFTMDQTKWGHIHYVPRFGEIDIADHSRDAALASDCANFIGKGLKTIPLTQDYEGLKAKIDRMAPYNYTNISLGAEFGWHVLTPDQPFNNARPMDDQENQKFMILLTDGAQTSQGYGPNGRSSKEDANTSLEIICDRMKADNIKIFTIGYDLNESDVVNRLKNCASDGKFYQPAVSGGGLEAAFADIGSTIKTSMMFISK